MSGSHLVRGQRTASPATTTVVVIGASMAGLVTARVLSDHVDRVAVVERDRLPTGAESRRGVPQGRHAHALLGAGQRLIDRWFPGLVAELEAGGAERLDGREFWYQGGGTRVRADFGITTVSVSRPYLETTVRRHLVARGNVSIVDGCRVDGLQLDGGRVTGSPGHRVDDRRSADAGRPGRGLLWASQSLRR